MVKSGLILVILVIGYLDANRVVARVPNDVDIFDAELMADEDQLLSTKLEEDYQNDEPEEGSGSEDNLTLPEEDIPDKAASDVEEEDALSKERDQDQDEVANDEEDLNTGQVNEEENNTEEEPSPEVVKTEEGDEGSPEDTSIVQETAEEEPEELPLNPIVEEGADEADVETPQEEDDTSKVSEEHNSELDEETPKEGEETSEEQNGGLGGQANEETPEDGEETPEEQNGELGGQANEETPEQNGELVEQVNEETSEEQEAAEKQFDKLVEEENNPEPESDEEASVQPDIIKETNSNEDDTGIDTDKFDEVDSGELEQQQPEENTIQEENKEDQIQRMVEKTRRFPNEQDLPAERFASENGMGKSLQMQEAESNGEEQKVEPHDDTQKEGADLPDEQKELEEQKDPEDPGASSASSGSNVMTFIIILGTVCVVAVIGYFVHKKRKGHQRATAVPTEDRELTEVKTHRFKESDDGGFTGGTQRKAAHIPEANPLILTNSHFKTNNTEAHEQQQNNGHLPTDQQQQALLTTLLATAKQPKDADDIRMMDDDGEEERPLVMSTFKQTNPTIGDVPTEAGEKDNNTSTTN